jgi:osmotically-inducible protein OsmY
LDTNAQQSAGNLSASDQRALLDQLDRTLESAGIHLASEIRDGALFLSGEVIEPEDHQAALDVAHALVDSLGLTIEDSIEDMDEEVESTLRDSGSYPAVEFDQDRMPDSIVHGADGPMEIDPDFTGPVGTTDPRLSAEEAVPYFPPTDPVVRTQDALGGDDDEGIEIVGGFAETAMDEDDDPATVYPSIDDDLAEAVMRELRQDAATADLASKIRVSTRGGVVLLTGQVETLEDSDEVAGVAERVDGVVEVREELEVTLLPHPEEPGEPAGR